MANISENKKHLPSAIKGFTFMVISCAVYLVWWFVNYFPDSPFSNFLGNPVGMAIWGGMFIAVFILCLLGVILIVRSFRSLTTDRTVLSMRATAILCIISSVAFPLLISRLRFITLDIFLIIWWAFLELNTANILYGAHLMDPKTAGRSFSRTLIYSGISLFLYIIYPFPPEYIRFILGAVPIILYASDMAWMVSLMKKQLQ